MTEGLERQQTLAEISIEPTVPDSERSALIGEALEALRDPNLEIRVGALSTTVIGTFDDIVHAVQRAHRCVAATADRVVTTVRIESKRNGIDPQERDADAEGLQGIAGGE
jgi:uncharacterized protein YqgV (UPF0045/DUF77 family)